MDQQKLRNLVFEKTGVRIDVDDPVFALVALNEAVLEEAVERHIALMYEASARITGVAAAPRSHPALWPVSAAVLGAALVLMGQALWFRPAPALRPAAHTAALQEAEKLKAVIGKLDQKTRNAIAAGMAQP